MFFFVFLLIQFIFYSQASYICPSDTINITDDSTSALQCYYFNNAKTGFDDAETFCFKKEGHLVSIHDEIININFTDIANVKINPDLIVYGVWLGLKGINGIWNWTDATPFDYMNWEAGEPQHRTVNCASLNHKDGSWISDGCGVSKPYSCIVPPILAVTTTTKNPNPPTIKIATTTTTKKNATTKTLPSTTTSPLLPPPKSPKSITKWLIIGTVLIVFIFIVGFILRYFIRKRYRQKRFEELQVTIKRKMELSPLEVKLSHEERLTKQIDSKNIIIDFNTILGKGANATVYEVLLKGKINLNEDKLKFATQIDEDMHAALKVPKSFFDPDEVEQFVRELDALIMIKSHPNIVAFIGWTFYQEIPALVTELANTNLLQYVTSFRGEILPIKTIISILWQISQALEHVASLMMVHRDVACRNILLTENNVAKLADFGLCCHCDESFTYQSSLHKRLPLKWLSIEALIERIFSEKSDVWAFGILCFEIFSFGTVPYLALNNEEMLEFLQNGDRLEKPSGTPDSIYSLMLDCWKEDPAVRPKFEEIGNIVRKILENETASYGYLTLDNEE